MEKKDIKTGTLLLSIPLIDDLRFDKTIIIITESLKKEKIGFVINKKTNLKVNDVVKCWKNKSILRFTAVLLIFLYFLVIQI